MRLRLVAAIVVGCVLGWGLHGCVTVERKAEAQSGKPEGKPLTRPQKENNYCIWSYDPDPGGGQHKIIKGSLAVKDKPGHEGQCGKYESGDQLYIGDSAEHMKRIISPPDAEFVTEGTCRYCYINGSGGMSCVTYPGC
jgi:hypothetical protein